MAVVHFASELDFCDAKQSKLLSFAILPRKVENLSKKLKIQIFLKFEILPPKMVEGWSRAVEGGRGNGRGMVEGWSREVEGGHFASKS